MTMARLTTAFAALCVFVMAGAAWHGQAAQSLPAQQPDIAAPVAGVRFEALDIRIDAGDTPLAAYQVQITAAGGEARIVGIEGGEHAAYADAPYYDPAALHEGHINERIIIAAFSTAPPDELPLGSTRIARLQIAVQGEAQYEITLQAAGAQDGRRIEAKVEIVPSQP